jgi:hypothetical protein
MRIPVPRRRFAALALMVAVLLAATAAHAQLGFGRRFSPRLATSTDYDGTFHFCRGWFRNSLNGDGGGWAADYPYADINLSIRLAELTKTTVSRSAAGDPNPLIIRLSDPMLYQCPFVMMTEVGSIYLDEAEIANLRTYLLKGGLLWVDDFWGTYAWNVWAAQIRKVLGPPEYPIVDLPPEHPLYNVQFRVTKTPQITNIGFWLGTGTTSERGADSAQVNTRAILDRDGRVMVLMTHNTDFGDSWEREGEDPSFFYKFAADGYAFGINVVLYSMTH